MELHKSKRWSIIYSVLIVTAACEEAEGDGDTEFSHVQSTLEGALTHKHDIGRFQDSTVLPGWTVCWCSGRVAWTETPTCQKQACGSSSSRLCTSPTHGFIRHSVA